MLDINGIKLYTTKELSELFGISYSSTLRYIRQGNIVKVKIGRQSYVSEQNLIDFLNGQNGKKNEEHVNG